MIITVEPRYASRPGAWHAHCKKCNGWIQKDKTYQNEWQARHAAAQHLWSHWLSERYPDQYPSMKEKKPSPPLQVKGKCPWPKKKRFDSKADARAQINHLFAIGKGNPDYAPYACQCGWWHVDRSQDRLKGRAWYALHRRNE
jgi:hypothetical protein